MKYSQFFTKKSALLFFSVFFFLTVWNLWYYSDQYNWRLQLHNTELANREKYALNQLDMILVDDWNHILTDITTFPKLDIVKKMMASEAIANTSIRNDFAAIFQGQNYYFKIRLIDNNGQEHLRLNINRGIAQYSNKDELEDKADRYYFQKAKRLYPGEIYVSPFDLDVEKGVISEPKQPTIRFLSPIQDEEGVRLGYMILSYDGNNLLQRLKLFLNEKYATQKNLPMVLNQEGYWLFHPDSTLTFGFQLPHQAKMGDLYGDAWPSIQSSFQGIIQGEAGLFIHRAFKPFSHSDTNTFRHTNLSSPEAREMSNYTWKLVSLLSNQEIARSFQQERDHLRHSGLFLEACILLLSLLLTGILVIRQQEQLRMQQEMTKERAITRLQGITLREHSFNRFLEELNTLIQEEPWLGLEPLIIILTSNGDSSPFVEVARSPIPGDPACVTASTNNCLCRKAALEQMPVFASANKGITPCSLGFSLAIPALSDSVVMGLLMLKIRAGQEANTPAHLSFFTQISRLLAEMIEQRLINERINLLHQAVEQSSDVIFITNQNGVIEYVNTRFLTLYGFSHKEVIGANPKILKSGEHPEELYRTMWQQLLRGQEWRGDVRNKCKSGAQLWVKAVISPIRNAEGDITHFLCIQDDITERIKEREEMAYLEKQLQQAHKMEALGHLTGGIAHDFNNILAAIKGYTELSLIRYAMDEESKLHRYLQAILQASERARQMIAQMLAFSRGHEIRAQRVVVEPIIKEVVKMMRSTLPSSISITIQIAPGIPDIKTDPVHLHQVLMNLFVNARDAMEGKGRIDVAVGPGSNEALLCNSCHTVFNSENMLRISVQDSGCGISSELLAQIFDPFYSTKEVGKGTGMGLSVVHGILHGVSGHIHVRSVMGQGTSFQLFFPALAKDQERSSRLLPVLTITNQQLNGTVLVVDDEISVAGFLKEFINDLGLSVMVCQSSPEALSLFLADPLRFDLVITDQTMPELTGIEMAATMLAKRATLPIILCTGYSKDVDDRKAMAMGIRYFFHKPLDMNTLQAAITACLTRNTTPIINADNRP